MPRRSGKVSGKAVSGLFDFHKVSPGCAGGLIKFDLYGGRASSCYYEHSTFYPPLYKRGRRRVRPPWAALGFIGAFAVSTAEALTQ